MREVLFFIIIAGAVLAIDLYSYQALRVVFPFNTTLGKIIGTIFWSVTIYLLMSIMVTALFGLQNIPNFLRKLTAAFFFLGLISKLFAIFWLLGEDLFRTFRFGFDNLFGNQSSVSFDSRRKFISQIAIFSAFAPLVVLTYGMLRNAYNYQFHKVQVGLKKLPSNFKGFKIIQLSDIHAGSFNQTKPIASAVEKINALNPDLILFTGDLVNDMAEEMDLYKPIFAKLKAKHGVFSVLGNHDYGDYAFGRDMTPEKAINFEKFLTVHKDMGWDLLRNENRRIEVNGQYIDLIGVENTSSNARFVSHGDLRKASEGLNPSSCKILMSHDPSHWDHEINKAFTDIDLTLAGHTHGFQFGIETKWLKWSPSQYLYKQWAGLYQKGDQYIYVNRGFGNLGYPGRVGILPEVTVMELT